MKSINRDLAVKDILSQFQSEWNMSLLIEIQEWYGAQCNGDWEHGYGIKIYTIDNPGWRVIINLEGTEFEARPFQIVSRLEPELDWIRCWVEGSTFNGAGGPQKLEEILQVFLNWTRQSEDPAGPGDS
jgi:hypothetical protein